MLRVPPPFPSPCLRLTGGGKGREKIRPEERAKMRTNTRKYSRWKLVSDQLVDATPSELEALITGGAYDFRKAHKALCCAEGRSMASLEGGRVATWDWSRSRSGSCCCSSPVKASWWDCPAHPPSFTICTDISGTRKHLARDRLRLVDAGPEGSSGAGYCVPDELPGRGFPTLEQLASAIWSFRKLISWLFNRCCSSAQAC